MNKLIIIDGNSLLFRAFYATYNIDPTSIMHTSNGIPTNAIFAFSNMLTNLLSTLNKGDGIFVAFDKGKHTFRHQMFKEYKGNRKPTPEELITQFPIAREFLDALNIRYFETDDIEADDICGIAAKIAEKDGYKINIYTSDKDYLQLIDDNISIKMIKKGLKDIKEYTPSTFKEEWGFEPEKIVDYKGLMGDPSDNLSGIPKVGDKTAKQLIIKYGDLENIIKNSESLTPSLKNNINTYKENGLLCKTLAKLKLDYVLPLKSDDFIYEGYDFLKISDFAKKYEFKNLLNKLPIKLKKKKTIIEKIEYNIVKDIPSTIEPIGLSIDISNDNYHEATLYGIGVTINDTNYYIEKDDILNATNLINTLKNDKIKKFVFDYKELKCVLNNYDIELKGEFFDLLLATYILEPSIKNDIISTLSYYHIEAEFNDDNKDLFSEGNKLKTAYESYYPLALAEEIENKLKEMNQLELLNNIELPLADVLADIEITGFPINKEALENYGLSIKEKIKFARENIFKLANHEFNINSTKELANVLYNELGLKDNKKHSTSVEYLKELENEHPIIEYILMYRKYNKLLTTYIDGFLPYIKDNLVHTTFNQALTQTGRLSSKEPNLQNIVTRDEENKQIKACFYYDDPNENILSLDYSQIELRVLASLSNCTSLIEAFNNDYDIHSATAKKIFSLDREPTSEERRIAKTVNFGIVYGISEFGLAEELHISFKEAKDIITQFNLAYPEIKQYLNNTIRNAETNGYSSTIFNRRRYITEFNSTNYQVREFAKRAAMNAPIQGSAADLIKIAMIEVNKALKEKGYKAKIISQIHDELLIKVNNEEKEEVFKLVKNIMENCVKLKVKLKVEGGISKTWLGAK